jgi:2-C-methyl-D-erythritol 4-phosphate cytidylyltransferase
VSAAAILLCAGRGERLGGDLPKAQTMLAGRPLFTWSLEALGRARSIDSIVVVGAVKTLKELLAASGIAAPKIVAWSEGGRERQDSVARGLLALPDDADLVAVHDSARALVTPEIIDRVVGDARQHGAAIAAVPLEDTLKRTTLTTIDATVPRASLWRAQTPQAFRRDWILAAHEAAHGKATDDAALVEALGHPVRVTPGDPLNLKITTPGDLELAEAWLERRTQPSGPAASTPRRD